MPRSGHHSLLPVNASLVRATEPLLIDTGMSRDRGSFENAAFSLVDPIALRWVVLTHDDRDMPTTSRRS